MGELEALCEFRPDEFGTVEGGIPMPGSMKDVPLVDKRLIPPPTYETVALPDEYCGLSYEGFALLVQVVRDADKVHQAEGGGTRHWVRDYFLPRLDAAGLKVVPK